MIQYTDKLQSVFADEEFVKAVFTAENDEVAQRLFAEKGINLSVEETGNLLDELARAYGRQQNGDELTEEDLEDVGGGVIGMIAAICGTILAVAGGSYYLGYRLGKLSRC